MSRTDASVRLRDVTEADLPAFFAHQSDPVALAMALFEPRDRDAFMAHWAKILPDPGVAKQAILYNGCLVGSVVSFERAGEREVGYWIDRAFWGRGIATRALAQFLAAYPVRPLIARVSKHNAASIRVLEKCGFTVTGEAGWPLGDPAAAVTDFVMTLGEAPA